MSNDLNLCQFIGRLGNDPEIRYSPNGDAVASFSIACGSQWKDKSGEKQERTEWVSCTAWGKLAEIIGEYVKKGSQVYVSGKLKTDKYEKDGQTRYSTKVIVDTMQMLGGKRDGGNDQAEHHSGARQVEHPGTSKPAARPAPVTNGSFDNFDDEIPFQDPYKFSWRAV